MSLQGSAQVSFVLLNFQTEHVNLQGASENHVMGDVELWISDDKGTGTFDRLSSRVAT